MICSLNYLTARQIEQTPVRLFSAGPSNLALTGEEVGYPSCHGQVFFVAKWAGQEMRDVYLGLEFTYQKTNLYDLYDLCVVKFYEALFHFANNKSEDQFSRLLVPLPGVWCL